MEPEELCDYMRERQNHSIFQSITSVTLCLDNWVEELQRAGLEKVNTLKETTLRLFALIEDHLRKKEKIFYPFVRISKDWKNKENAKNTLIKNPIRQIADEQINIRKEWMNLRNLTAEIESIACNSKLCATCLTGLFDIEQELNKQFHLEQTILFPKLLDKSYLN